MVPPEPQWLLQEPEGPGAPKTPGRWKTFWASDCERLETAHQNGDGECLVYGRKYIVDMKDRTVRPLYFEEKPERKPVIRATYFVRKGGGWTPYPEVDAEMLEDTYVSAKVQLAGQKCEEVEVPLSDDDNKVVMTKKIDPTPAVSGQPQPEENGEIQIDLNQKPIKPPSILATTFTRTTYEVHRGTPESGSWAGGSCSEGDRFGESNPPDHLVFLVHGIGESLWSKSSSSMASLRTCCAGMRELSAAFRQDQMAEAAARRAAAKKKADAQAAKAGVGEESNDTETGLDAVAEDGSDVGYVEFLPVEWFEQIHGDGVVEDGLVRDITLPTLPMFRDFANQAIMDVMYYLTPRVQKRMLTRVANEMNRMWAAFSRVTPGFTGKVSIVGHSLGSIISHDILMAQPSGHVPMAAVADDDFTIPVLDFKPEMFLACGSPIGTFLSLRADSLEKGKLFKFATAKRFYNVFHPADPVAYRLEPMIDRTLKDLPPENVPHRGGDRIHIKVKKLNQNMAANMNAVVTAVSKTADESVTMIQKRLTAAMKSVIGDSEVEEPQATGEEVLDARMELQERIDWVLQETPFEGMNPWAAAVYAHGSYFQSMDLVMFIVNALDKKPLQEDEQEEEELKEAEREIKEAESKKDKLILGKMRRK